MQPSHVVSQVSQHARLLPFAEKAALVPSAGHYPTPNDDPALPDVPVPNSVGKIKSETTLLSDAAVKAVKEENTKRNLQSNFWFDMSNYLRWSSTISMLGGLALIGQAVAGAATMGAAVAAVGAAIITPPVLLAFGLGAVLATATIKTSTHSKKLFIERSFDVQDFQMQRQAALVGQSVGKAMEDVPQTHQTPPSQPEKRWVETVGGEKAQSHVASLSAQNVAEPAQASR